jgi:hypothetical protein
MADKELGGLLDKLGKKPKDDARKPAQAAQPGDAWIAKFNEHKQKVIRPTLEKLGAEIRAKEHDFNIVDTPFKRHEMNPRPTEASVRMDLYLNTERTRTMIGQDRRPHLAFTTNHKNEMVEVTICDITSRGGIASKIGDFAIEQVDAAFIRDKFVALFKRIVSQQPAK